MLTIDEAFPSALTAVIRYDDPEVAFDACLAAAHGGIQTLEVTRAVPDHLDVIRRLREATGGPVGVGTVMEPSQAEAAAAAGAAFVVTPVLLPDVAAACRELDILCVLGALTPSEIHIALRAGAGLVKIFPIASVGGPRYVQLVTAPLGRIPIWVSGGVSIEDVPAYLRAGVRAIGLTDAVFAPDALKARDYDAIRQAAERAGALAPVA